MKNRLRSIWLVSILVLTGITGVFIFESEVVSAGSTIYVDDDNLGFEDGSITYPFNTIQEGVDAASDGDTVYVFSGTYGENVQILNKSLSLIGEDKNTTIIDGDGFGDVIYATSYWYPFVSVNITGFTITHGGDSGIKFESVEKGKVQDNIITNNYYGINIEFGHSNNITGNTVLNNDYGIYVGPGMFNNITGNTILNNERGIQMITGQSGIIKGNTLDSNGNYGILTSYSNQIEIIDNHISSHNHHGIYSLHSVELTFTNNTMLNDGIYIYGTLLQEWNTHHIDTSNTVNGKPVYYWKNQTGGSIPPGGGQVILANCTNVTVEGQELTYGDVGIMLGYSSNCSLIGNNVSSNDMYGILVVNSNGNLILDNEAYNTGVGMAIYGVGNNITGNTVSFNGWSGFDLGGLGYFNNKITGNTISNNFNGIYLSTATSNEILANSISNNTYGIYLKDSTNNSIYHNNIIDNINQAYDDHWDNFWDNGYPGGGNYWSDYTGIDLNSTPAQNVPPPDGIGDTPYVIDIDSQDNYPLMDPYIHLMFLYEGWNLISIPLIQNDTNVGAVLSSISDSYDAVQWFNITDTSDPWKHNSTSKPEFLNELHDIIHTMGFWIHITEPGGVLFEYAGSYPIVNQSVKLHPGWNMVGYPSLSNRMRPDALNNIDFGDDVDAIWTHDARTQTWEDIGPTDHFEYGRGYWIHSKVTKTWEVPL